MLVLTMREKLRELLSGFLWLTELSHVMSEDYELHSLSANVFSLLVLFRVLLRMVTQGVF